jgi:hypothetical protein
LNYYPENWQRNEHNAEVDAGQKENGNAVIQLQSLTTTVQRYAFTELVVYWCKGK